MNYTGRREALLQQYSESTILVQGGDDEHGNANLRYLTGLVSPEGVLLVDRRGMRVRLGRAKPGRDYQNGQTVDQILFLPEADPVAARWGEDAAATTGSVTAEALGVDAVLPLDRFEAVFGSVLQQAGEVRFVGECAPRLAGAERRVDSLIARVRTRFPNADCRDATPAVHDLRRVKDDDEIGLIQRAVAVTAEAFDRLARSIRPGGHEYEFEAMLAETYRRHGAGFAFEPIVGSGSNALKLHYRDNDGPVESGHLVLVDSGASVEGYRADVTRTYPSSGRFSSRQREVYEAVLAAQQATIEACRPGVVIGDLHEIAWNSLERAGFGEHFPHGTSHHLGLETHDVGDPQMPLEPGCVLTVEPGAYLADEDLGVRIEDDILITENGHRVLTQRIPKTVADVERLMGESA